MKKVIALFVIPFFMATVAPVFAENLAASGPAKEEKVLPEKKAIEEKGDIDFAAIRDNEIKNMEETINCLRKANNWNQMKRCKREAVIRQRKNNISKKIEYLQKEQKRIEELEKE